MSCFSQHKDELIIEFNNSQSSRFIKASLQPDFCCLSFPKSFNRARKNSIDLFNDLLLKKVIGVQQYLNERSFSILFEDGITLLFKMHGNRANIILFKGEDVIGIFRNHLSADRSINLNELDRHIDWSLEAFLHNTKNLSQHYFTYGKWVWHWLEKEEDFSVKGDEEKWNAIIHTKSKLENPDYYLIKFNGKLVFSLLPFGEITFQFNDPIQAINEFFHSYIISHALQVEKSVARKLLQERIKAGENYIEKNTHKANELLNDHHYQLWGDLLMAHLHEVKPGMDSICLKSFYDNSEVEIPLKKEVSPQKNAEVFYRKAKNKQIEVRKIQESIARKATEVEADKTKLQQLDNIHDLKLLKQNPKVSAGEKRSEKKLPFFEFEYKGFKIWVGKNAESNDQLTLKYAHKEDLWLHVKDVAGSHVIIKHQSGKPFPKDVIERAAQLAAYNSKRKTESLCPVAYTPKKFVHKRKGDPAGAVVIDREDVILVEPKLLI